jgi:hypothetical protein
VFYSSHISGIGLKVFFGNEIIMSGQGACYVEAGPVDITDELKGCHSQWRNLVLGSVNGLSDVYFSLFPEPGTYGLRCIESKEVETESHGSVHVECVEVAYEGGKKKRVVVVGDSPALGVLHVVEQMPEYRDAVVIPG